MVVIDLKLQPNKDSRLLKFRATLADRNLACARGNNLLVDQVLRSHACLLTESESYCHLHVTERAGLGISWDEEQPPMYGDVPASPPSYVGNVDMRAFEEHVDNFNL